ncbi:fructosamine-3-kinase [Blastomyces dermatitidis ER-3]|uniref:protein-ribulosamine 3-kinase n=1 Tax=Ajellomyces dermatitidis (strain ER-3 / ATCC MYA-2586) TaxID=559297 RepID=A0ABP2EWP3_AJEDR|nr:fructosamine-3-kinase [Blastomyces dermatitidis ER-3]EEQ87438.2 fructosamine-3-kinase [Blastomyces dermatitidis ER-3]
MKLDQAVIDLLSLDTANTTVSRAGGGCSSASAAKITTKLADGTEKRFFMKTATGEEGKVMVQGSEDASLKAIHAVVPTLCPQSFGWGAFSSPSSPPTYFLVVEFLEPSSPRNGSPDTSHHQQEPRKSLAEKLAQLHTTPAPVPDGYSAPQFGFPVPTCCGDTAQDNSYRSSWASFYAENRLRFILQRAEAGNDLGGQRDGELRRLVERTIAQVVPRLLGDEHLNKGRGVTPVVVHGDLWSGNAGRGSLAGRKVEEVIFDPSAFYGHSEYELGIMRMFGGFGGRFLEEYHELCPKTEPVEEYKDRVALYELYHQLNHYALFGGSYRSGAMRIMEELLQKYGS